MICLHIVKVCDTRTWFHVVSIPPVSWVCTTLFPWCSDINPLLLSPPSFSAFAPEFRRARRTEIQAIRANTARQSSNPVRTTIQPSVPFGWLWQPICNGSTICLRRHRMTSDFTGKLLIPVAVPQLGNDITFASFTDRYSESDKWRSREILKRRGAKSRTLADVVLVAPSRCKLNNQEHGNDG